MCSTFFFFLGRGGGLLLFCGGEGGFSRGGEPFASAGLGSLWVERDKVDDRRVEQDFDAGCGRV